jgi:hypothetical protein
MHKTCNGHKTWVLFTVLSSLVVSLGFSARVAERLTRLENALFEAQVENEFLGRKIEELHLEADLRLNKQECQTDIAVAGIMPRRLVICGDCLKEVT